jgi:diguanylate cyclase (GGDEF)-like protein
MKPDSRVVKYRQAAERMQHGDFNVEISTDGSDEIARLGASLQALAKSLKVRFEEQGKLAEIAERVNAGLVLEEVLEHVYESFRSVMPYDRIGLALLENDGSTARAHWARSESEVIKLGTGYSTRIAGTSLAGILDSGRPRILNDLEAHLEAHPESESTRLIVAEGMRSSLTCPLAALGKPTGFLFFSSREKDTYREIHQGHFMQLASQISVILEKSRLYEELLELNNRLQGMQGALEHEANHDALTSLWNRRAVLGLLEREIARAQRGRLSLAAVMLDLDRFKHVNDEHGHLVGDEVLVEASRRIVGSVRAAEVVGRLGGEEFLLVLCPCDELAAGRVMERVRVACGESPFAVSSGEVRVTVSLGAATVHDARGVEALEILSAADRALYQAKGNGRNRWELEAVGGPKPGA